MLSEGEVANGQEAMANQRHCWRGDWTRLMFKNRRKTFADEFGVAVKELKLRGVWDEGLNLQVMVCKFRRHVGKASSFLFCTVGNL